jgi:hypothetical protein
MYTSLDAPTEDLVALMKDTFRKKPVAWKKPHTGLSSAQRFVVTFEDGTSLFVKASMDDVTESSLRIDHLVMSETDESFVPQVVAWIEPPTQRPVLVTEDLSQAHWPADYDPVLWKSDQFEILFKTLNQVSTVLASDALPRAINPTSSYWREISQDPESLFQLGLCSENWLKQALPELVNAEQQVILEGDALVHGDVRSDNLCFFDRRMILVDWSQAQRGSPLLDLSSVITTLPLEGGPDPVTIMPHNGDWAAYRSGQIALRTLKDTDAPMWLNKVFQRLTIITLRWATTALKLPTWDGKDWREI